VGPTIEEFGYLLFVIPVALLALWGSSSLREAAITFMVLLAFPLAWFFISLPHESAEAETQLRSLLGSATEMSRP
jgi:hypothetical protein